MYIVFTQMTKYEELLLYIGYLSRIEISESKLWDRQPEQLIFCIWIAYLLRTKQKKYW